MFSFCMWSPILYFEVAIQSFELFRFHFFCNISIDVQCSWNIWMSECVLNDLYIYSSFTHSCCKCMSKRVTAKMRKQHIRFITVQKLLIIAITDNSSDCLLSVAWCCAWPKRLMKIKSVYPSIVTSQWSPKSSCFCFSCSNVSLAAFGITIWPLLPIVTVPHKCLPIGAGAIFISSTLLSWWTSESIVTP